MTFPDLAAGLAGLILVFAAFAKAVNARPALAVVRRMVAMPDRAAPISLALLVAAQAGLGAMLLADGSSLAAGLAFAMTLGLTAMALWGRRTGKVTDCGCYGQLGWMTPAVTWALDGVLLASLAIALAGPNGSPGTPVLGLVFLAAGGAGWTALVSLRLGRLLPRPALRPGLAWPSEEPQLLVFVSADCPLCKSWIKVLAAAHRQGAVPPPVFVHAKGHPPSIGKPTLPLPGREMNRLVDAVPVAALVEGGRVTETWRESLPPEWVEAARREKASRAGAVMVR